MRSLEHHDANNTYSNMTNGLYQSLESEKVNRVSREPIDTSKQFESIEPNRIHPESSSKFEASRKPSPPFQAKTSPSRRFIKNMVNKYGRRNVNESDVEAIERMNCAATIIQRMMKGFLCFYKVQAERRVTTNSEYFDDNMDGVDEAQDEEEEESSYGGGVIEEV